MITPSQLSIKGRQFVDDIGRTVILRGVNLAGISVPFRPNGATHQKNNWPPVDIKNISWIGRPFPLDECEEHFMRLKSWGFNCVRLLTSWEAIEHEGPYIYDEDYLDYYTEIVRKAGEYGFYVLINFHQDVWSRVTGGDGHPLWTFEKIGLDFTKFDAADAAHNMQYHWNPDPKLDRYRNWGENTQLFPVRTMWTLFWAGQDFAPNFMLQDEYSGEMVNIGEYLRLHFMKTVEKVAERVKNMPHIIGFNPLNEPSAGYIGMSVSKKVLKYKNSSQEEYPEFGLNWTPLDTMAAATGYPRKIDELGIGLTGIRIKQTHPINQNSISIWKDGATNIWKSHGVWGDPKGVPIPLIEDYFKQVRGQKIDFTRDYLVPFHIKVAEIFRNYNPNWLMFIENDPGINGSVRCHPWPKDMPSGVVDAFHWYDLSQLGLKRFLYPLNFDLLKMRPVWGLKGIQKMYIRQMKAHVIEAMKVNGGNCPQFLGEFGISMDMRGGKAFKEWKKKGNKVFKRHEFILDLMYNAIDELQLNTAHWNYAANNCDEFGDQWNMENLSIFSQDQVPESPISDRYSGARGIGGFCRPYPIKTAGSLITSQFARKTGKYRLEYKNIPEIPGKTEVFIPDNQYPKGIDLSCEGGNAEYYPEIQRVLIESKRCEIIKLTIARKK